MNYQNFATYNNIPPGFGKEATAFYDRGSGIPPMTKNNMTIQDIYRTPFLLLQDHTTNYPNMAKEALKGIQSESELSKLFFSDVNIKRIQKAIRAAVYRKTNGEFRLDVDQDQKDLFLVMRATYLEEAKFIENKIVHQVKRLNEKVVSSIIFPMITEIKQYYGYLKEINKPLSPIPRPISVNNAGRRALPSISTVLGV